MSKVICEVCGTAYPETSTQCPICGSARQIETAGVVEDSGAEQSARSYTYVKGGRFSKSNVRKRNRSNQTADTRPRASAPVQRGTRTPRRKSNTGLVIVTILLLLAIAAVVVYLMLKFFWPPVPEAETDPLPQATDQVVQTDPVAVDVPCQALELDVDAFRLTEKGSARMMYVTVTPADTTYAVQYTSSDESVAIVSANGKVEAVGVGTAVITVSCGDVKQSCTVICEFIEETTGAIEETTEETTVAAVDFRLNREDITFGYLGEKWMLYSGDLDVTQINWSTDNPAVATIKNGTVVAEGVGTTKVYGEYNGVKVACIIRCSFSSSQQGVGGHGGVGEDS